MIAAVISSRFSSINGSLAALHMKLFDARSLLYVIGVLEIHELNTPMVRRVITLKPRRISPAAAEMSNN